MAITTRWINTFPKIYECIESLSSRGQSHKHEFKLCGRENRVRVAAKREISQGNKTHTFIFSNKSSSLPINLWILWSNLMDMYILRLSEWLGNLFHSRSLAFIKFSFCQSHKFFRSFSPLVRCSSTPRILLLADMFSLCVFSASFHSRLPFNILK